MPRGIHYSFITKAKAMAQWFECSHRALWLKRLKINHIKITLRKLMQLIIRKQMTQSPGCKREKQIIINICALIMDKCETCLPSLSPHKSNPAETQSPLWAQPSSHLICTWWWAATLWTSSSLPGYVRPVSSFLIDVLTYLSSERVTVGWESFAKTVLRLIKWPSSLSVSHINASYL